MADSMKYDYLLNIDSAPVPNKLQFVKTSDITADMYATGSDSKLYKLSQRGQLSTTLDLAFDDIMATGVKLVGDSSFSSGDLVVTFKYKLSTDVAYTDSQTLPYSPNLYYLYGNLTPSVVYNFKATITSTINTSLLIDTNVLNKTPYAYTPSTTYTFDITGDGLNTDLLTSGTLYTYTPMSYQQALTDGAVASTKNMYADKTVGNATGISFNATLLAQPYSVFSGSVPTSFIISKETVSFKVGDTFYSSTSRLSDGAIFNVGGKITSITNSSLYDTVGVTGFDGTTYKMPTVIYRGDQQLGYYIGPKQITIGDSYLITTNPNQPLPTTLGALTDVTSLLPTAYTQANYGGVYQLTHYRINNFVYLSRSSATNLLYWYNIDPGTEEITSIKSGIINDPNNYLTTMYEPFTYTSMTMFAVNNTIYFSSNVDGDVYYLTLNDDGSFNSANPLTKITLNFNPAGVKNLVGLCFVKTSNFLYLLGNITDTSGVSVVRNIGLFKASYDVNGLITDFTQDTNISFTNALSSYSMADYSGLMQNQLVVNGLNGYILGFVGNNGTSYSLNFDILADGTLDNFAVGSTSVAAGTAVLTKNQMYWFNIDNSNIAVYSILATGTVDYNSLTYYSDRLLNSLLNTGGVFITKNYMYITSYSNTSGYLSLFRADFNGWVSNSFYGSGVLPPVYTAPAIDTSPVYSDPVYFDVNQNDNVIFLSSNYQGYAGTDGELIVASAKLSESDKLVSLEGTVYTNNQTP